jgi:hypothetical protein
MPSTAAHAPPTSYFPQASDRADGDPAGDSDHDPDDEEPASSGLLGLVLLFSVVFVLLCGATLAVVVVKRAAKQKSLEAVTSGDESVVYLHPRNSTRADWVDASEGRVVSLNDVPLAIERVEYGEVRAKDATNRVIVSAERHYLQIQVRLRNRRSQQLDYQSWYGNTFAVRDGTSAVMLEDDDGRRYDAMRRTGLSAVRGHTPAANLSPNDTVTDVLVFVVPDTAARRRITHFRLRLPAAAYGGTGEYRFLIPRAMIDGF